MTLNEELEMEIELIFKKYGETLTDDLKTDYWNWKKLKNSDKIIKEVNQKIEEYREQAKKYEKEYQIEIGKQEIEEQEVPIYININLTPKIATLNYKYHSLYEKSNENTDKKIINPTLINVSVKTGDITYKDYELTKIGDNTIPRFLIEEALSSFEGYPEETVSSEYRLLEGKTKMELEDLLEECDNEEIYEEYKDINIYSIEKTIELIKSEEIETIENKEKILKNLEKLKKFSTNEKYMTKEQEEFFEKYKEEFEKYKEKEPNGMLEEDVYFKFIKKKNKELSNDKKIYVSLSIRPGMQFIEEFNKKRETELKEIIKNIKPKNKNSQKKGKTNVK